MEFPFGYPPFVKVKTEWTVVEHVDSIIHRYDRSFVKRRKWKWRRHGRSSIVANSYRVSARETERRQRTEGGEQTRTRGTKGASREVFWSLDALSITRGTASNNRIETILRISRHEREKFRRKLYRILPLLFPPALHTLTEPLRLSNSERQLQP